MVAQSQAELDLQDARIDQVKLQLQADVVRPAEAQRDQMIARAKADAVQIIEQGKATADVLRDLAAQYRGQGAAGRDVLLMQKLVPVLKQVAGTIGQLKVDRLTVIGAGGGNGASNGDGSLAGRLVSTNEQIKAATGVDVAGVLRQKVGDGEPTRPQRQPPPPPAE